MRRIAGARETNTEDSAERDRLNRRNSDLDNQIREILEDVISAEPSSGGGAHLVPVNTYLALRDGMDGAAAQ